SAKQPGSASDYRIDALAYGVVVAGSVSGSPGLTGAFSGAGSVAINRIDNTVEAAIRSSGGSPPVRARRGHLTSLASDDSTIRADSGGFALALALPLGGTGVGTSVTVGGSWSQNQIGKATDHGGELLDFDAVAVNEADDTITRAGHGLNTGERVTY